MSIVTVAEYVETREISPAWRCSASTTAKGSQLAGLYR